MNSIETIYTVLSIISVLSLLTIIFKFISKRLKNRKILFFDKLDKLLAKVHKHAAISLIVTGLLHGAMTLTRITDFGAEPYILGTLCLLSCIASAGCFYLKKRFKKIKHWVVYHRIFTVIALVTLVWHIALSR